MKFFCLAIFFACVYISVVLCRWSDYYRDGGWGGNYYGGYGLEGGYNGGGLIGGGLRGWNWTLGSSGFLDLGQRN